MKHRPFSLVLVLVSLLVTLASAQVGAAVPKSNGTVRINEVMFYPQSGQSEWVELKNAGTSPVSLQGWGLTDEDGSWYRFPSDLLFKFCNELSQAYC
jgi:P pilus assembly chaperone PapD